MIELETLVISWATEKGILPKKTNSPIARREQILSQLSKLVSEVIEVNSAIILAQNRRKIFELIDAIGDSLVTFIIQLNLQGSSLAKIMIEPNADDTVPLEVGDILNASAVLMCTVDTIVSAIIVDKSQEEIEKHIRIAVTLLSRIANVCGKSLQDCLTVAYNVISNRSGEMVNGVFVKDE